MASSTNSEIPRHKVELHVHLDGAVRPATIWDISKKKGLSLPGDGSLEALQKALIVTTPESLFQFLKGFQWILPALTGDLEAIERISYEFVEDKAAEGAIYVEARCSVHLTMLLEKNVTAEDVTRATLNGFHRGEKQFGTKVRLILVCMRGFPEYAMDTLELCTKFRNEGVVGIDVAGDEASDVDEHGEETFHPNIIEVFKEAQKRGIHRTAHAGEAGPANGVLKAMEWLDAERIGHGYRIFEDESIYLKALQNGIHFETCPNSSILTGAVPQSQPHPITKFAQDNANFSISTDDPTITNTTLAQEYELVLKWGLTAAQIIEANRNAIRSSFLPENEKQELLWKLMRGRILHPFL